MQKKPGFINCNTVKWALQNGSRAIFTVARLDELHPFVSGNKYFKLKYNIEAVNRYNKKGIITMGGAYSNHLPATAFACREAGLASIGIVRGGAIAPLNHTLTFCKEHGMMLINCERNQFNRNSSYVQELVAEYGDYFFVPEGGDNPEGLKGCEEILTHIQDADFFRYILCCMGTGTTFRGIAAAAKKYQTVIGIPVLKIKEEDQADFLREHATVTTNASTAVLFSYGGRGYAKQDNTLVCFMNQFYRQTGIPTDFVYTAKLMYAVNDLFEKKYFEKDAGVLVLHTGGLQGNDSLPRGTLAF
jgi:1-aminocyclopropane-1-carboxylate deaminase